MVKSETLQVNMEDVWGNINVDEEPHQSPQQRQAHFLDGMREIFVQTLLRVGA